MKKMIIFALLFFLLIGVVSANENLNDTISMDSDNADTNEPLSVKETSDDTLTTAKDVKLGANETTANTTKTITVSNVTGTAKKQITLQATLKNSSGVMSGVNVTFKFNGVKYTAVSDANGTARVNVTCPATEALKTTTKITSKTMTKTKAYSKVYTVKVSANNETEKFSVISTKESIVKTYKIINKKTIKVNVPVRVGVKVYKKGKYSIITEKVVNGKKTYIDIGVYGKQELDYIKIKVKEHVKQNGNWKWASWFKVKKGNMFTLNFNNKKIDVNKIKVKYTQATYQRIK